MIDSHASSCDTSARPSWETAAPSRRCATSLSRSCPGSSSPSSGRAAAARARCSTSAWACWSPTRVRSSSTARSRKAVWGGWATCRSATCCCPGGACSTTCWYLRTSRAFLAEESRARGSRDVPALRPGGLRAASIPRHCPAACGSARPLLRTWLTGCDTLLLDEPFGALDALTRRELQDWLLTVWQEFGRTVVFITHDVEEAVYLADRVIVLSARPGTVKRELEVHLASAPTPEDGHRAGVRRTGEGVAGGPGVDT